MYDNLIWFDLIWFDFLFSAEISPKEEDEPVELL